MRGDECYVQNATNMEGVRYGTLASQKTCVVILTQVLFESAGYATREQERSSPPLRSAALARRRRGHVFVADEGGIKQVN